MIRDFHKFWLKIAAIVVGSFGPIFFFGTMGATSEPARWTLDLLIWPIDGAQTLAAKETRFILALSGGFLLGWGVTVWCLSAWVYDAAPEGVRKSVVVGFLGWFILDGAGSIAAGVAINVVPNILILLIGVGPLWRPAAEDRTTPLSA